MANIRPLINLTDGWDIWQQVEREVCHVTGCVWDSQFYLGIFFHDCATASVLWRNATNTCYVLACFDVVRDRKKSTDNQGMSRC
jgi:hypothetical protein